MSTKPLWIKPETDLGDVAPLFFRDFSIWYNAALPEE